MAFKGKDPGGGRQCRKWPVDLKLAIVKAYEDKQGSIAELAKTFGVPQDTAYTWLKAYRERGEAGLAGSRARKQERPKTPGEEKISQEILDTKKKFSWFGIRRITQWLTRTKLIPVTETQVEKTLKEADLVTPRRKKRRRAEVVRRFERSEPNSLWQVDITMWTIAKGQKVYLIGFIDDYSRYMVGWGLYAAQGSSQVLEVLRNAIGQYGAPKEILSDQGRQFYSWRGKSPFQKELAREGIQHVVSRSHHPQTLGKIEAFWKHLKEEFLDRVVSGSINDLRERLRLWIDSFYNFQRPHQGIDGLVPADRYLKMADQVRSVIEKGVKENAERLAVGKEPIKPFYMVGQMGDKQVVIRQEGSEVVVNVGNQELEKIQLNIEEKTHEKTESGNQSGDRGPAGESPSDGGLASPLGGQDAKPDLPGDGTQDGPVLQTRKPDAQGHDDGGSGEPGGRTKPNGESGRIDEPPRSKSETPTGEPPNAIAPAPDQKALQNEQERPKTPSSPGTPAQGPSEQSSGSGTDGGH
jgi:transposase InsO family protein